MLIQPRVVICVPSEITEVEERAVEDAVKNAGARSAYLIEEPVAAALGAGIDITAPSGNMVVDIGGGTTDIAVISLEGVVVSESIKVAGDKFDEAIIRYVRQKYNMLIGERTAESIKIRLGSVSKPERLEQMDVKGRCLAQGLPKYVTLNNYEMLEALLVPITAIIDAICQVIERTPPELVADIINNGIVMTGGGAMLRGFDKLITDLTGIRTYVAKDAMSCVAIGTGRALDHINLFSEGSVNYAKRKSTRI
jgi:rod shape-determining protein MreB